MTHDTTDIEEEPGLSAEEVKAKLALAGHEIEPANSITMDDIPPDDVTPVHPADIHTRPSPLYGVYSNGQIFDTLCDQLGVQDNAPIQKQNFEPDNGPGYSGPEFS